MDMAPSRSSQCHVLGKAAGTDGRGLSQILELTRSTNPSVFLRHVTSMAI